MKRILLMVFRNILLVPFMWIKLCYYAAYPEKFTDEQHFELLRYITERANKSGNVIKLMDAPAEDLIKWYKHAYEMLHNVSPFNPGKITIKNTILKTWDSCNTELFMRWLLHEKDIPGLKTKMDLLNLINEYKVSAQVGETLNVSIIYSVIVI